MKAKAAVRRIIDALSKLYPDALCSLTYEKDYELLFAVRLSAQCTAARVNMVPPALYARFPTLESFANATYEEVGEAIHSCGFYHTKAKDLVECAKLLLEKHGGKVPDTMEELLTLPGVGRKTANVFLNTFYGLPTFGVDTHVLRLSNRIGIAAGKTPFEVEKNLEKAVKGVVPDDDLKYVGHWLVLHGRYVCAAKKPACDICPIADLCEKNGL